jgi:hypothetical protein
MYPLGHEDPTLTMRIHQQVLYMGGAAVEVLESVLGCSIEEAFTIYSGREVTGPKPDPTTFAPRQPDARGTLTHEPHSWSGCQRSG